ncbi:MAG: glycine/sarcosine/betaine reductase selenoprotein B family protein [Bacillota bacterium]
MSNKLEKFVNEFPWVENETAPWAEFNKTLKESKVAVVSTGGLYVNCDKPFQIEDREDVDESFREIPLGIESEQIEIAHEHYEKRYVNKDINTVFPVERLKELVEEGFIGELSNYNFSISGYIPKPDQLFATGKEIAEKLSKLEIDAVLIIPV